MQFADKCTKIPAPLEHSKLEIFEATEEVSSPQASSGKPNEDTRDWRSRPTGDQGSAPAAAREEASIAKGNKKSDRWTQKEPEKVEMAADDPALKIQKAADIGRQAWMPGQANAAGEASSLRKIKGILNKLTPEKFERLASQMVELIVSAEVLRGSISYIFENAVAQPTFVQMYAELCAVLSKALPDFPPSLGENKPQTFKRILLNTCQEEYEGATRARDKLDEIAEPEERLIEGRNVKQRMLGNVRLISHLHKIGVVNEKIIHLCMREQLGDDPKVIPPEDNIEAICEMLSIIGATLAASSQPNTKKFLDGHMARLEKLGKSKSLSSRVRFLIKDTQDMKHNNWVPRREAMTAKKLSEVHTEAQAELGIVLPGLQTQVGLPTLNLGGVSSAQKAAEEDLLPSFGGAGVDDGWSMVGKGGKKNMVEMAGKQFSSSLVGEYIPMPSRSAAPAASSSAPAAPAEKLTPEKLEEKAKSLLNEYISVFDIGEAIVCIKELNAPEFMARMVELVFSSLYDCTREKEHAALVDLLVSMCKRGACTKDDLVAGLKVQTDQIEDLRLDIPLAPKLIGMFLGESMVEGVLGMDTLRDACNGNEDTGGETKRILSEETFKVVKQKGGDLGKLADAAGVKGSEFLAADPDLDPPDLPSVEDWLSQKGFSGIPV